MFGSSIVLVRIDVVVDWIWINRKSREWIYDDSFRDATIRDDQTVILHFHFFNLFKSRLFIRLDRSRPAAEDFPSALLKAQYQPSNADFYDRGVGRRWLGRDNFYKDTKRYTDPGYRALIRLTVERLWNDSFDKSGLSLLLLLFSSI
jgi:hypothetical protein